MWKEKGQPSSPGKDLPPKALSSAEQINALLHSGVQKAQQNHQLEAVADFRQVLKLDPNNELGLLWLGYLTADVNEAMGYFDRVLRINPLNVTARRYYDQSLAQKVSAEVKYENISRKPVNSIPWLGDLLLELNCLSNAQLKTALARQEQLSFKNKWKPLGEILIQLGYINRQQLDNALSYQKEKRSY